MICSKRDQKNFANVEELLQNEIPRINFAYETSSFDEIGNKDLKSKDENNDLQSNDYEKIKPRKTENYKKYGNGNAVVGLGEHTPSFLSQSFSDRLAS